VGSAVKDAAEVSCIERVANVEFHGPVPMIFFVMQGTLKALAATTQR
jgi:hypothetical protein